MISKEANKWFQQRVSDLTAALVELGIETEHLDSLVHECADDEACRVNNDGMSSQVAYLLSRSWTTEDITGQAKMAREDDLEANESASHVN